MEEAEAEKDICWLCGKGAKQKCSACKSIYYCSRKHQKLDWKRHSNNCRSFELKTDPRLGRHYVAKRKIEVGMIVLREEGPLLAWPPQDTPPVCLGCYTVLRADNSRPCENCGWPLCCNCKNHDRDGECEFTMRNRGSKVMISDFEIPHPMYRSIGVIRALALRDNKPEAYRRLLKLEDHCLELSKQYGSSLDAPKEVANFVKRFFKIEGIGEEEIAKVIGILQINGHEVPITESPHIAIYDEASYLEHNCYANCSKSFTEKGGIIIRAALPISKGDHISICYTDPLWGVTNRRHFLAQTKFFGCACERCKDPTEFGTMFNAIKCTENKCNGDMLPPTFMSSNGKSIDYACWKCKTVKTGDEVDGMLDKIGMELTKIVKDDVNACKKFLNDFSGVLHVNHFYNVDVALALALIIGQQGGGLSTVSNELLNEKILLCKRLTVLLEILVPAENRMRGMLLFELHTGIAEFAKRQHPDASFNSIKESRKVLADSYQLLRYEPEILPEGKLAKQALKNLREIDAIIKTLLQKTASPA